MSEASEPTPVFKVVHSGCGNCGYVGEWPAGTDVCPDCGDVQEASPDSTFSIPLAYNVQVCETCDKPAREGRCPECGAPLDPVEPNAETRARVGALRPLLTRADELVASFDQLPVPHIPVTDVQAICLVVDANLFDRARELIRLSRRIGEFNLSDPAVIGRETRAALIEVLDEVESVRDEARLLASFAPQGSLADLPAAATSLARCGAEVVAAVVDVVSAASLDDATAAAWRLQRALRPGAEADRLSALLDGAVTKADLADDLDRRASIALGLEAKYTDQFGFLDPIRVFSAPEGGDRLAALASAGGRYLIHLLETPATELPGGAAVLALFAAQLAMLDRPFVPHRQAELARELLGSASAVAPDQLSAALVLYDARQGRVYAAGERARRELRQLQLGISDDPFGAVESALSAYKRFCEGPYREQMRLLIAARQGLLGKEPPSEALLLGEVDGYLEGWPDELGTVFRKAADRELRNAIAHEDYEVDRDTLEVILPGERRVSPDELGDAFRRLMGTVAALDAAIICCRIDARDVFTPPDWLTSRDNSPARTMLLEMVAGACGLEIGGPVRETDGVLMLDVLGDHSRGFHEVGVLLAAASKLSSTAHEVRATTDNHLVAAVSTAALKNWDAANPLEADLALIEVNVDAAVRVGVAAQDAVADACALAIRLLFKVDLEALLADTDAQPQKARLARRLRRTARFAAEHDADFSGEDRHIASELQAASQEANALVFDGDRLPELVAQLRELFQWALGRGTSLLGFELAE